jgi:formylglycine-generating enzyme required for sulfatase activity
MTRTSLSLLLVAAVLGSSPTPADAKKCKNDAVRVGNLCVDTYEASVWETTDAATIKRIQKGTISDASQLTGAATQRGLTAPGDYGCAQDGAGCADIYAVSIAGVMPSVGVTWFQAVAACRNAGKRLLTNVEWQAAAMGTPDTGGADDGATTCNTDVATGATSLTGSRTGCVSDVGAFDMAGNLSEWVADWVPTSQAPCTTAWGTSIFGFASDDQMCLAGAATNPGGPGTLVRGGDYGTETEAGPLAVRTHGPASQASSIGFRCAREP